MKTKDTTSFLIIFGAIFFAAGMMFALAGIMHMISLNEFKERAEAVEAEITYIDHSRSTRSRHTSAHTDVFVSYTVDGQEYERDLNYYTAGMHVGDTIEIYVDPENPSHIEADAVFGDVIFMIVGGIFAFIGGCFVVMNIKKKVQGKRLLVNGEQLSAVITSVYRNNNIKINGRHPYKMECEYTDPYSGEKYLFSSDNVMSDISGLEGYTVTVYADRDDRSKYYIDVNELTERYNEENKIHDYR